MHAERTEDPGGSPYGGPGGGIRRRLDPRRRPGSFLTSRNRPRAARGPARSSTAALRLVLVVAAVTAAFGAAAPARAAAVVNATIEDTAVGTGLNQVTYSGTWTLCGGCSPATPNNSFRYSTAGGASATVRFTGTQFRIYGIQERSGGLATVSIDGSTSTTIDTFRFTSESALLYNSPVLANGTHTATLTNIGQRNPSSTATVIGFDRVEALTDTAPPGQDMTTSTIEDGTIGTGPNQITYTGNWLACGGCVPASPNNSFRYSTAGGSSATIRFTGTQVSVYGIKERHGGIASISVDFGLTTTIDTYAPTSSVALLFSSSNLSSGSHIVQILNTGQRNPASDSTVTGFDRAVVATTSSPVDPLPPPTPGNNRSGLPWLSGVNGDPLLNPASVDQFCATRGSLCDLAHVYVARDSWGSIVQPSFAEQNFAGWPGRLLISVPLFPENSGSSLAACAAGDYDAYWRTFGTTLNSTGRQNSIIRLGWQANGNWFQWSAYNAANYVDCWRRAATAIRATANPDPVLDWTINAHYSQLPPSHNPTDLYPGDAYVDSIGIDAYDHYPPSPDLPSFNSQANAVGGITWLYNFARAHGKQFGIGEWGVAPGSDGNGGGDSADYIQWMHDWMAARAGQGFLYEAYFNNCDPGNVGSNLFRPFSTGCVYRNPNAAGRYTTLWRNPATVLAQP
ncbi:glycoside hydrolase family 26 protein [Frankia sp. AgB32]|uniref:glycoside hydrolase family 26 protein n=1 Tax=Frankia sp. AgB32 TaxID=631119 RepID=UPI00200CF00E|nr:glycosyl hydrolase [Frankia sp. AgB32]MCK9897132.1 endoglucanase [Frankia sp. AgB32]